MSLLVKKIRVKIEVERMNRSMKMMIFVDSKYKPII